ncbi:hypothetical protein AALP_AA8G403400 [Arabis alpina]|uniref:Transmembrane protein n=1 Tax=Arabis alpina TaxID=50452 RepID=A0A087GCI7_ARAAL|nr:hypothetical protein AALP_AA8G403400 [Arabis alpina]
MMMKLCFIIVALLMFGIINCEIVTEEEVSPSLSQWETEMAPTPTMFDDNPSPSPSPSQIPEAVEFTVKKDERSSGGGGKKAGIAFATIAAASMVGVGGYLLKKRRENIRRSRYEYAATEII